MPTRAGVHEKGTFSLLKMIEDVKKESDFHKAGAIALFIGVVRGVNQKGEKVKKLELEAYEEKANSVLHDICRNLKKKKGVLDVQIHHLLGEFNVGDDLVYVLVTSGHRENLFPVLEEAVERYKKKAPIFKKEYVQTRRGEVSSAWVAEGEADK
jgi:molybdopterin synthase catalytic subunit